MSEMIANVVIRPETLIPLILQEKWSDVTECEAGDYYSIDVINVDGLHKFNHSHYNGDDLKFYVGIIPGKFDSNKVVTFPLMLLTHKEFGTMMNIIVNNVSIGSFGYWTTDKAAVGIIHIAEYDVSGEDTIAEFHEKYPELKYYMSKEVSNSYFLINDEHNYRLEFERIEYDSDYSESECDDECDECDDRS